MQLRRRYLLNVEDRFRLHSLLRLRFSPWLGGIVVAIVILIPALLGFMAGYRYGGGRFEGIGKENRAHLSDMVQRLDSLRQQTELSQAYVENISRLLDTGRMPSDSALAARPVAPMPPESLHSASEAERAFVTSMENTHRHNYRVSALASLAAEGVLFGPVTVAGVQTQRSKGSEEAEIAVPGSDPVMAPADARVIDLYFSGMDGGYTLLLQHPRGFLSRLSGLGRVIVETGSKLNSGDPVGFGPGRSSSFRGCIRLRLWHNGSPLIPENFIHSPGHNDDVQ